MANQPASKRYPYSEVTVALIAIGTVLSFVAFPAALADGRWPWLLIAWGLMSLVWWDVFRQGIDG